MKFFKQGKYFFALHVCVLGSVRDQNVPSLLLDSQYSGSTFLVHFSTAQTLLYMP